ncbi:MAG: MFS transporter [Deltaproteobacteria bacterium]|nr:MFS transporter [Deltaproteobacteria bacterium]
MTTSSRPHGSTLGKLGLLGSLYFSQGLPFGFFTQALPVLLRKAGFSLGEIGLTSLLAMPWALKFLWAPIVDRHSIAGVGKRKSWIVPLQLAAVVVLAALALSPVADSMNVLMGAVLLLNLVAATQDIATDGLAVEMLEPEERGFANGLQVAGYRVGMIVGGGVLLIFHDRLGSSLTFLAMAALTALATLPIIAAREASTAPRAEGRSGASVHFLRRPGAARLLLLIVTYKAGDAFATGMLRPFLADVGLGLREIGWLLGTVGFVAGLLGALAGGVLVNRLGRKDALTWFGLLQAASVAGYAYLALGKPSHPALYVLCAAEHFAGGMATAALFTCMMDWCSQEASGTDYTVQASAVVIATGAASAVAGFSAQALGYFGHFSLATALALGALVAVRRFFPTTEAVRKLRAQPSEVMPCS